MKSGRNEINSALDRFRNLLGKSAADPNFKFLRPVKRPKNLVLFVGDGLGLSTVTAARIYKGQSRFGSAGEEDNLVWETFPDVALLKVHFFVPTLGLRCCSSVGRVSFKGPHLVQL